MGEHRELTPLGVMQPVVTRHAAASIIPVLHGTGIRNRVVDTLPYGGIMGPRYGYGGGAYQEVEAG